MQGIELLDCLLACDTDTAFALAEAAHYASDEQTVETLAPLALTLLASQRFGECCVLLSDYLVTLLSLYTPDSPAAAAAGTALYALAAARVGLGQTRDAEDVLLHACPPATRARLTTAGAAAVPALMSAPMPGGAHGWRLLGDALASAGPEGSLDAAAGAYAQALALAPWLVSAQRGLARAMPALAPSAMPPLPPGPTTTFVTAETRPVTCEISNTIVDDDLCASRPLTRLGQRPVTRAASQWMPDQAAALVSPDISFHLGSSSGRLWRRTPGSLRTPGTARTVRPRAPPSCAMIASSSVCSSFHFGSSLTGRPLRSPAQALRSTMGTPVGVPVDSTLPPALTVSRVINDNDDSPVPAASSPPLFADMGPNEHVTPWNRRPDSPPPPQFMFTLCGSAVAAPQSTLRVTDLGPVAAPASLAHPFLPPSVQAISALYAATAALASYRPADALTTPATTPATATLRGRALLRCGRVAEAADVLQNALELAPWCLDCAAELAEVLWVSGGARLAAAVATRTEAVARAGSLVPSSAPPAPAPVPAATAAIVELARAIAHDAADERPAATRAFQRAAALSAAAAVGPAARAARTPGAARAALLLTLQLADLKQDVRRAAALVLAQEPACAEVHIALARDAAAAGNRPAALTSLQRALELGGKSPSIAIPASSLYSELSRPQAAAAALAGVELGVCGLTSVPAPTAPLDLLLSVRPVAGVNASGVAFLRAAGAAVAALGRDSEAEQLFAAARVSERPYATSDRVDAELARNARGTERWLAATLAPTGNGEDLLIGESV